MIQCDLFETTARLVEDNLLQFQVTTDLPPGTRVLVSCERTFVNYLDEHCVWIGFNDFLEIPPGGNGCNRAAATIDITASDNLASSSFRGIMKGNAAVIKAPVSDELRLVFTVGARQRLREFGKNNSQLVGKMVKSEGGVAFVSAVVCVHCPMATKYQPKIAQSVGAAAMTSKLFYKSGEPVELGDHVAVYGWFGIKFRGNVSYIPGISPRHRQIDTDDVQRWAITAEDGTVYVMIYDPERSQPSRRYRFLGRGTGPRVAPTDVLE